MLVQPGQQVSEGESIVILEAMKMETSVSAPKAGQIVELRAKSGDSVTVGDVLLTLA
jgi:oxaloacetate decarboxylase alpha subunit